MSDTTLKITSIATLKPGLKNLVLQCIVLQQNEGKAATRDGHVVYTYLVADASGSIELSLWDEVGRSVIPGDILRITGGYASLFKTNLRLYSHTKYGQVSKIGSFTMLFSELPNMSANEWKVDPLDGSKFVPLVKNDPNPTCATADTRGGGGS